MEKILTGLLLSDQPLPLKKSVVLQIANAGKLHNVTAAAFDSMVNECFRLSYKEPSILSIDAKELISTVAKSWVSHNVGFSKQYIEQQLLAESLKRLPKEKKIARLLELMFVLDTVTPKQHELIAQHGDIQKFYYDAFTSANSIHEFALLCKCYLRYPFLLPKDLSLESVQTVLSIFMGVFSETPISEYIAHETKEREIHQYIFKLLKWLVEKDSSNITKIIGNKIFNVLTKEGPHPSVCVAKLLQFLNLDELSIYIDGFIKSKPSDDTLTLMTSRLIDWICLPDSRIATDQWVMQVLKFLIQHGKFQVLFAVVEGKIRQVFHLIFLPVFRTRALSLATFMLISYMHSPKPFHQVSALIPKLLSQLKEENSENSQQAVKVIAELTYTLMYHYPGFPDIYEALLTILQDFSRPSEASMKTWLKSSFAISQVDLPDFIVPERELDSRVGLDNLGNTCYANSVMQALFNLRSVTKMLLEKGLNTQATTTKSLQELFVQLALSKRSSVAPRSFLTRSRPPWFQAGFQQDCSEYLKFLLDKLQTESVDKNDDINTLLSGKMKTSVECLNCGFVSAREELFNDIPLSFHQEIANVENVDQTLKGGDSSDRMKRKIDCTLAQAGDAKQTITDEDITTSVASQFHDVVPDSSKQFTIRDMFCSYLTPEILKDSNQYFCENCTALQNAKKTIDVIEFPQYLILTMKRFTYNVATQKRSKLLHVVNHPQQFALCTSCARCHEDVKESLNENAPGSSSQQDGGNDKLTNCACEESHHFRLLSVIVHSGQSSDSGHYYSYTCEYGGENHTRWRLMNDSRVTNAPLDCISKLSSRFPMDTPYVCIYEKFDSLREMDGGQDIGIQKFLLDHVKADDTLYEQELQRDAIRRRRTIFTSTKDSNDDTDNNGGGGGNGPCGPGGSGGFNSAGGRFVF